MLETVLMVLDFIVCIALIGAVMLQSGKGGGMGGTFGGSDAFAIITLALAKLNA